MLRGRARGGWPPRESMRARKIPPQLHQNKQSWSSLTGFFIFDESGIEKLSNGYLTNLVCSLPYSSNFSIMINANKRLFL